jgi:hypothetical protein
MANGASSSNAPKGRLYVALWLVEGVLFLFWGAVVVGIGVFSVQVFGPIVLWGIGILMMIIMLALAGREITGRWPGVLIDSRNKFSLSRLQITLWTIMVLSAYLAVAMPRVAAMIGSKPTLNQEQALDIRFPEQLILAMGISAVSFAGANMIKSNKESKTIKIEAKSTPEVVGQRRDQAKMEFDDAEQKLLQLAQDETNKKEELDKATAELNKATDDAARARHEKRQAMAQTKYDRAMQAKEQAVRDRDAKKKAWEMAEKDFTTITEAQGLLPKNADPSEARWFDLLSGEEMGNYKSVAMSKVQMLFFTVIVIATYSAAISSMLRNADMLRTAQSVGFPDFAPSLTALLGISHGTYLSVKTIDHS